MEASHLLKELCIYTARSSTQEGVLQSPEQDRGLGVLRTEARTRTRSRQEGLKRVEAQKRQWGRIEWRWGKRGWWVYKIIDSGIGDLCLWKANGKVVEWIPGCLNRQIEFRAGRGICGVSFCKLKRCAVWMLSKKNGRCAHETEWQK
jgi:hypothetical protein